MEREWKEDERAFMYLLWCPPQMQGLKLNSKIWIILGQSLPQKLEEENLWGKKGWLLCIYRVTVYRGGHSKMPAAVNYLLPCRAS